MLYAYVLISRACQPRSHTPISGSLRPPYAKCGLVPDLGLDSPHAVFRIPDMHVTVWISWQFSIFGFSYITLYMSRFLSVLRTTTFILVALRYPPPSPFSSLRSVVFSVVFSVYLHTRSPSIQKSL